jgi:hypothetical protein
MTDAAIPPTKNRDAQNGDLLAPENNSCRTFGEAL